MKRKNKLLIALLSVSCLTAGAFGLVACNNEQADNRDQSIVAVYNQYVAYAEGEGQTPLTYDEWIVSIKGANGTDGKDGTNGKDGANGKSAYEIYCDYVYKNDGNPLSEEQWIASLTGGDGANGKSAYELAVQAGFTGSQEQWLASLKGDKGDKGDTPVVHVHTYDADAEVTTVIEPTTTNPGIGYIHCADTACDHIELVVLNTYSYMVRLYDVNTKEPVKGATVTINDTELTTDENGVVIFKDMQKGEYDVVVSKSGYGLSETYKTSTTKTDFEIALYPAPSDVQRDPETWSDYFVPAVGPNVGDKASYYITAVSSWNSYEAPNAVFKVENGKIVKYKVTVYGLGAAMDANYNNYFEGESFNFVATSDYTVSLSASDRASGSSVNYIVTFERMEAPALGSSAEAAMLIEAEKYVNVDVAPGTVVHFVFNGEGGKYQLPCQDNTTVNYNGTPLADEQVIKHGGYSKSYFTATSTGASIGFKLTRYYEEGEKEKPIKLTLDTETTSAVNWENGMYEAWYEFDVATAGRYTVEGMEGTSYSFVLYNDVNGTPLAYTYTKYLISGELNVGKYYVKTTQTGTFKVRAYNESTDLGLVSELPKAVTTGNVTLTEDTMYLKYEVTTTGYVSIFGANSSFTVYSDGSYANKNRLFSSYEANLCTQVTAGDILYIKADIADKEEETASITIYNSAEAPEAVNYTFKVVDVDGNPLGEGFKVVAKLGGEEVKNGTTAAGGTVTLALAPDVYTLSVDVGEKDYEYTGNVTTKKVFGDTEVVLELAELVNYKVTVTDASGTAASGIEVVLKNASTAKTYTATTDSNGVATFKVSAAVYEVSVVSDTYEVSGNNYIYANEIVNNGNFDVSLAAKPVALKDGMSVTAGTVYKFSAREGNTLTVSAGYIVSYHDSNYGYYVEDGEPSVPEDNYTTFTKNSAGKVTTVFYDNYGTETFTVVFSENATVTLK